MDDFLIVDFGKVMMCYRFYSVDYFDYSFDYFHDGGWIQNKHLVEEVVTFVTYQLEIHPNNIENNYNILKHYC